MNFTPIYRTWEEHEAEMVKELLKKNNIECYLSSQVSHSVYPIPVNGLGEIKVMVEQKDSDRAKKIIKTIFRGEIEENE